MVALGLRHGSICEVDEMIEACLEKELLDEVRPLLLPHAKGQGIWRRLRSNISAVASTL